MTPPVRYAVILDPLGMANVVSDREPGPGRKLAGLTGEWYRVIDLALPRWAMWAEAAGYARAWNAMHKPARPAESEGE